jgi:hypothetical protein
MSKQDPNQQEAFVNSNGFEKAITGPHAGYNKYGELDHFYFECSQCGGQSVNRHDLRHCC